MIELIENDFLRMEVNAFGAELKSIFNKENQKEYLWQADPAFWARRAPVLFPIVGKLKNNTYKTEGKSWTMNQHGFARDVIFQLTGKTKDSLTYSTKYSVDSLKQYPYKFELQIQYSLKEKNISTEYKVINLDDKNIFFSIGGHPGFTCPINPEEKITDYYIEFETKENAVRHLLNGSNFSGETKSLLKHENIIPLSEDLFHADAIVLKNLKSSYLKLKSKKSDYELVFNFKGFPYLGIWKKIDAPFICIEPWFGLADYESFEGELKEKEGIISLAQREKFVCTYLIKIK
jgi:galactose mutarotase-like enzyme